MIAVLVAWSALAAPPSLFIENDPRLGMRCTVVEENVTPRELVRRLGKSTGVELIYGCSFVDPHLTVYARNQPCARVLQLVASALDLDWRSTESGWKLVHPDYVKAMEDGYDAEVARATAREFRRAVKVWRSEANQTRTKTSSSGRRPDGVPPGDEVFLVPFIRRASAADLARIERGETVVGTTLDVPGTVRLPGNPSDYPTFQSSKGHVFVAVRLDLAGGALLHTAWRGDRSTRSPLAKTPLVGTSRPFAVPEAALAVRNARWSDGIDEPYEARRRLTEDFEQQGAPPTLTNQGSTLAQLAEIVGRFTGRSVVIVRRPAARSDYGIGLDRSFEQTCTRLAERLPGGIWHIDAESLLWRPSTYRFRFLLGVEWQTSDWAGSVAQTALPAVREYLRLLQSRWRTAPPDSWDAQAKWSGSEPSPAMAALVSELKQEQLAKAVKWVKFFSTQTVPAEDDGLKIGGLDPHLRSLAMDALRTACLTPPFPTPKSESEWKQLLATENAPKMHLRVVTQRADHLWFYDANNSGYGSTELPNRERWDGMMGSSNWVRCAVRREWVMHFVIGLPGGPAVGHFVRREAPLLEMTAEEVRRDSAAAFDKIVKAMTPPDLKEPKPSKALPESHPVF